MLSSTLLLLVCLDMTSAAVYHIPSKNYISHLRPSQTSQEGLSFTSAIQQVNADISLLPNTTVHVAGATFNQDDPIQFAVDHADYNISGLFVYHNPGSSQESLSALLNTPLVTARPSRAVPANGSSLLFGISVGPSPFDISAAMVAVAQKYKWNTIVVIVDIRWRDHASVFTSLVPSSIHYDMVDIVFDSQDNLQEASKDKLALLTDNQAHAFAVFCDGRLFKSIIDKVHSPKTHQDYRTHNWLLADPIESSDTQLRTERSQVVIGFAPTVVNSPRTQALEAALSGISQTTKYASYLLYDAVFVYAHALHNMLVDNLWEVTPHDGNLMTSHNGQVLMSYMKQLTVTGTTGVIQFDSGGNRRNAKIDVFNLRSNQFTKIGEWSSATPLSMTMAPATNSLTEVVVPLSQLKRKLKVAILGERIPFIIPKTDATTGNVTYTGYSVDLINAIAELGGFEYEFLKMPSYGGKNPDGTYSGLFGELQSGRADLSVMPLTINSARLQYLDFSEAFMHISMDLVIRKPKEDEIDITGFMTPYTVPVWLMTLVCWFYVTISLSIVNYYSPYGHRLCDDDNDGDEFSFFNSLWFCLASMLQQGGDATPRMLSGRIVTGSFWFCVLVWVSTYTANLAAFLTTSQGNTAVANLDDVLEKEYSMYINRGTALYEFFRLSDYQTYRLLFERMLVEDSFLNLTEKGEDKVRNTNKAVFLNENPFVDYIVKQEPCNIMSVKGLMGSSSYGIAMPKHFPYGLNISRTILKLQETGKLEDMRRKWWDDFGACPLYKKLTSEEEIESKRIQVGNLVGIYVVLALGGIVSVVVVAIEIEWKKRRDRMKAKVRQGWATIRSTKTVLALQTKPTDNPLQSGDVPIRPFGLPLKAFGAKKDEVDAKSEVSISSHNSVESIIAELESQA